MRMQSTEATCGPTAMGNALAALGIIRAQEELEILCKTSATKGTDTGKMMKALRSIQGVTPVRSCERTPGAAMFRLASLLSLGRPGILCVDNSAHWVSAIGGLGLGTAQARYLVADSGDLELVLSYTPADLVTRWGPPFLLLELR